MNPQSHTDQPVGVRVKGRYLIEPLVRVIHETTQVTIRVDDMRDPTQWVVIELQNDALREWESQTVGRLSECLTTSAAMCQRHMTEKRQLWIALQHLCDALTLTSGEQTTEECLRVMAQRWREAREVLQILGRLTTE